MTVRYGQRRKPARAHCCRCTLRGRRGQFYIVEALSMALSYIPTSSGYEPSCASASDGPRNAGGGFAPSLTRMASACTPRLNSPVSMRMS